MAWFVILFAFLSVLTGGLFQYTVRSTIYFWTTSSTRYRWLFLCVMTLCLFITCLWSTFSVANISGVF